MFNSGHNSKNNQKNSVVSTSVNLISQNTSIKGEVHTQSDIRIDGKVEGTIYSKARVVIGESGMVEGTVYCQKADIAGKLKGNIYTDDMLHLKNKGVVNGDMFTQKLIIESGSVFNGKCEMGEKMVEKYNGDNEDKPRKQEEKQPAGQEKKAG